MPALIVLPEDTVRLPGIGVLTYRPHANRESWLEASIPMLRATVFGDHVEKWPTFPIRVACGWPKGTRGGKGHHAIGQCWSNRCSKDGASEIFVSPELDDPIRVLDVLSHELVHAIVGCENGHRKPFGKLARAIGLEGKLTATVAGPALLERLHAITSVLWLYPHASLLHADPLRKKQTTRMLKVECPACGCIVRMTAKWIEDAGIPTCACGTQMESDGTDPDGGE
jgi:hypothetical protein